jgi:hypothetical protein
MWRNSRKTFVAILVVAILSACATGYQSSGITGGYTEKKITDSAYVVTFGGNGFASKDRINYFWIYRCAELTLEKGYSLFSLRANESTGRLDPPAGSIRPAVYYAEAGAAYIKTHASGGAPIVTVVPGGGGPPKWTYTGTVLMYQKPLPEELVWAVDAQAVVAALKPYVASNGSAPAPTRDELFNRTLIAHARISVGRSFEVAAGGPGSDAGKPPRSAEQIAEVVESARLVLLHTVYREYVTHLSDKEASGNDTKGHITLEFSVSPNGQVTRSKITYASFLDLRFNSAIEELVKQTEFGPKDVVATDVKNFDIAFGPWSG